MGDLRCVYAKFIVIQIMIGQLCKGTMRKNLAKHTIHACVTATLKLGLQAPLSHPQ